MITLFESKPQIYANAKYLFHDSSNTVILLGEKTRFFRLAIFRKKSLFLGVLY